MLNSKLNRRQFLRAGARSAVLALAATGAGSASDGEIVSAAIHPAIGIGRIGNSISGYYLGPELPGAVPLSPGGFKDASGAIKRQAARFRVYGLDRHGRLVREITADEADITWHAHLTNSKAAWYNFQTALDIPEAQPTLRRNATYVGAARSDLVIDPGTRAISGRCSGPVPFDGGAFFGIETSLGELRTDNAGRLLVLGGNGRSFSPIGARLTTFANNDGWCDDSSDGPVTATVRLGRRMLPVTPAWVIIGPPNYGPALATGYRTLYDVMTQTMIDTGLLSPPANVSFLGDIYPLFDRLSQLQWVNYGMLERYGWQSPEDFLDPAVVARLADPCTENEPFRRALFERFRNPDYATMQPNALPPLYGDAVAIPASSPRDWLAVTPVQYANLARWANGDFVSDLASADPSAECLEDLPREAQPIALDRAALEACLGEAFHPGCEATWPMRIGSMYSGLFRLRHRNRPEPDYGDVLTPELALAPNGPLDGCVPGSVTRWLAVPWQTDTVSCRSGYEPEIDPYLPTFWAARVPNHVFTQESYRKVLDRSLPLAVRQQAFDTRAAFFRDIDQPAKEQTLANMVENWFRLGLVEERPGPGDNAFPRAMRVETERGFPE
ncbi:MAG: LodA/GoxA family CTQ-dependent oxidase [Alphaproteobacteria bacterium]|nr:LodA/GoxA family CTQ-dependent oxidase [Alphaproteobacteria bacterium]